MHIAEQVSVDRPCRDLHDMLSVRPGDWLVPFATLAWTTGLGVLHRRTGTSMPSVAGHHMHLDDPRLQLGRHISPIRWKVVDASGPFASLVGNLVVEEAPWGSILSFVGEVGRPREPAGDGAAIGVAELVVRSLLGHLRRAADAIGDVHR